MLIGGGLGGVGELDEMGGAWTGLDVAGESGVDVDADVDAFSVVSLSFSSFFLRPNMVSIPMTVKRVQMGSRLASWTSIRSTHT